MRSTAIYLSLALVHAASAQNVKLSGPQDHDPGGAGGDVESARFTPDGSGIVYLADGEVPGRLGLYGAPALGGPVVRLSAIDPEHPDASIEAFDISSDGQHVVYRAYSSNPLSRRVWSVRLDGAAPPVLLADSTSSPSFVLALDGRSVVCVTGSWPNRELRRILLDASESLVLDQFSALGDLQLTFDGSRAIYLVACPGGGCEELRSVPIDGSAPATTLASASDISSVVVSSAGRVVYMAPAGLAGHSVLADGTAPPVRLFTGGGSLLSVDPTGQVVVIVRSDALHAVPIDGSGSLFALTSPIASITRHRFQFSPDGARVVFTGDADPTSAQRFELFAVPISGGALQTLSGPVDTVSYQVTPDSIGVVFVANEDGRGPALYATPFGGARFALSAPPEPDSGVADFAISPDDLHVLYRAGRFADARFELLRVAITGGPSRVVSGPLTMGGSVQSGYAIAPDSTRVAYRADARTLQQVELFSVPVLGLVAPVRVNAELVAGPSVGEVGAYQVSPDGETVVYAAAAEIADPPSAQTTFGLYRVSIHGGPSVRLSERSVPGGGIQGYEITADGTRVVYLSGQGEASVHELFSATIDGSSPSRRLSHSLTGTPRTVQSYTVTTDGGRVVYRAREGSSSFLWMAPVDGSAAPLRLTPTDIDGGNPSTFLPHRLTSDGSTVVFAVGPHLHAVASDGSGPVVRLTPALPPTAGLSLPEFEVDPRGRRVVYRADARVANTLELFSAVIGDAGYPPLRLSGSPSHPIHVAWSEIDARGARVVYMADERFEGTFEIYSVPIEGARHVRGADGRGRLRRVRLSPSSAVSTVQLDPPFRLSSDGIRVLFAWGADSVDLRVAAIDGSSGSRALVSAIEDYVLTPDGRAALVLRTLGRLGVVPVDGSAPFAQLDQLWSGVNEFAASARWAVYTSGDDRQLSARPLDGSMPPILFDLQGGRVKGHTDEGHWTGATPAFRVAPGEGQVVYLADPEVYGRAELWSAPLPSLP